MSKLLYDKIAQGEGLNLDFKYCVNDSKKIARSMVAFANTSGGALLLGVKDNGNIKGINFTEEIYMIEQAAELYCSPKLNFLFEKHFAEGKVVLEIIIPFNGIVPYKAIDENGKWKVYIRKNDENLLANRILLEVWKNEKNNINTNITFNRDIEMLFNYLDYHNSISFNTFRQITNKSKRETEDILIKLIGMKLLEMEIFEDTCSFSKTNIV
ncbi:MAG: ATP-binding protein [Bacteroidales bacterium]|nr:ATP-binding protein [Bacteroidales bacterium]